MIVGIGTDIVEVSRLEFIASHDADKYRLFTKDEHAYCLSKATPLQHYAGMWAVKEAYIKATGHTEKPMNEIEIMHNVNGQTFFDLHDSTISSDIHFHLTISHESEYAVATVIIERL